MKPIIFAAFLACGLILPMASEAASYYRLGPIASSEQKQSYDHGLALITSDLPRSGVVIPPTASGYPDSAKPDQSDAPMQGYGDFIKVDKLPWEDQPANTAEGPPADLPYVPDSVGSSMQGYSDGPPWEKAASHNDLKPGQALAQKSAPIPLEKLHSIIQNNEAINQLDKLSVSLAQLSVSLDQVTLETTSQCMLAFGTPDFCQCLANNLPIVISFEGYLWSVIRTKDEAHYDSFSDEDKTLYDDIVKVRDECVLRNRY